MLPLASLLPLLFCVLLLTPSPTSANYTLSSLTSTPYGYEGVLRLSSPSPYGHELPYLHLSVWQETPSRLRVALRDANATRWEIPSQYRHIPSTTPPTSSPPSPLYTFRTSTTASGDFAFQVVRTSTKRVLFDSSAGPLHYSPQYIELSTSTSPHANLYGFGERILPLRLPEDEELVIWNTDWANPDLKNLYGHHPVYQQLEEDGLAHAVVLYNSNMMDGELSGGRFRYRVIGGIIDLYFLLGPTPLELTEQYTSIVGRPFMPPLWSVGWHQCRCFYESANRTLAVVLNYTAYDMPLDAIWNDIDIMRDYVFGTYNDELGNGGYTVRDVTALNTYVKQHKQKRVWIVDPNIPALLEDKGGVPYLPYIEGKAANIFVRHPANDTILYGKQWPTVAVAWPDWTNPGVVDWWTPQYERFGAIAGQMDGIWLDMNEPSAFCPAEITDGCNGAADPTRLVDPAAKPHPRVTSPTDIPYPPFQPGSQWQKLEDKSFNISSHHYLSQHYNVKEMWGMAEQAAAAQVMQRIHRQRAFTLSRSTFMGSGAHGAHWLGDNNSLWSDLVKSIAEVLAMGLYGVVNVGADICGFGGETTEEMCVRWIQLGSLYPFARSHNAGRRDQEPYQFGDVVNSMNRNSLRLRYSLLPYLYQLFVTAHFTGAPVWRPLYMHWPTDSATWAIDRQFMLGPALLGIPAVDEGATTVTGYLPEGQWFDFLTFARIPGPTQRNITLPAPITPNATISLLQRGGYIVARQQPMAQTVDTWVTPISLHIALNATGHAQGTVTLDDGVSLDNLDRGDYHAVEHVAVLGKQGEVRGVVVHRHGGRVGLEVGALGVVGRVEQVVLPFKSTYDVSGMYIELVVVLGLDVTDVKELGTPTLTVAGRGVSLSQVKWSVSNGAFILDARGLQLLPIAQPWTLMFAF